MYKSGIDMNKDYSFQEESVEELKIEHITLLLNVKHCFYKERAF